MAFLSQAICAFIITLIKVYQYWFSPLLSNHCRFYPSCTNYSLQAFQKFGLIKGSLLTIKRLFCCHPFHPGGFDPLPKEKTE